jgi:glycerol-3-phosphate dehydrogenase (NAD(P)+)
MNIAILGAGAWGTALAVSLAGRHRVALWARDAALAAAIRSGRRNSSYLPEVPVPDAVTVTEELSSALAGSDLILIATPTSGLREVLEHVRESQSDPPVVWACKGLEQASGKLPHQVVAEVLGKRVACGALSGPSFALEVAQGRPTALTLAARDALFAKRIARELHQPTLRVYFSTDLAGVEISGAVKNVMAIASGISDGLGLGLNARAALITRGLAELSRLGLALGGRTETFMGLAGAGDLILTCTGDLSRNRRVGLLLARGEPLDAILKQLGHVAEGVYSARAIEALAAEKNVDMPITRAVCAVLFRGTAPRDAVQQLLARDPREEA